MFAPFKEYWDYFGRAWQQWIVCFGIDAIQKEGWNSEVGTFARMHDPEGNPIELWQPADTEVR